MLHVVTLLSGRLVGSVRAASLLVLCAVVSLAPGGGAAHAARAAVENSPATAIDPISSSRGSIIWLVVGAAISLLGLYAAVRRRAEAPRDSETEAASPTGDDRHEPQGPWRPPVLELPERLLHASPGPGNGASELPERLGPYLLIDRIGEGGLSEVFTAARYAPDGSVQPLVVKRLRRDRAEDAMAVMHFLAERELGAALLHPNIATILDFGEMDGQRYLVEEYISGRDLGRLTRRMVEIKQRPLSARAILYVAHEVLRALEYAHARLDEDGEPLDLVHRDVTPENIVLSDKGEVKLLDFGIAQVRGSADSNGAAQSATVKGNVDFMSPEQARGWPVDRRADLFSVGLVIYFCAARAPLYRGKTLYDRLLAAASGPGERERAFIAGLPPPLPDLLPGLLAIDPAQRFQNAKEVRERIAPHCAAASAELADAIQRLFGDELVRERDRLEMALLSARGRVRNRPAGPRRAFSERG
jgi:serine/threonine protein kinase